jgi:hypothetical protein
LSISVIITVNERGEEYENELWDWLAVILLVIGGLNWIYRVFG